MAVLNDWIHARPDPCSCDAGKECANCHAWRTAHAVVALLADQLAEETYRGISREVDKIRMRVSRLKGKQPIGESTGEIDAALLAYREIRARRTVVSQGLRRSKAPTRP